MAKMGAITCCLGCRPPERSPDCHTRCEKYIAEKAAHDEYQAKVRKGKKAQNAGITADNMAYHVARGRRRKKGQT